MQLPYGHYCISRGTRFGATAVQQPADCRITDWSGKISKQVNWSRLRILLQSAGKFITRLKFDLTQLETESIVFWAPSGVPRPSVPWAADRRPHPSMRNWLLSRCMCKEFAGVDTSIPTNSISHSLAVWLRQSSALLKIAMSCDHVMSYRDTFTNIHRDRYYRLSNNELLKHVLRLHWLEP